MHLEDDKDKFGLPHRPTENFNGFLPCCSSEDPLQARVLCLNSVSILSFM